MKTILAALAAVTLFASVAHASDVVAGIRYQAGAYVNENNAGKSTTSFNSTTVIQPYAEWRFINRLGIEVAGKIGNTIPKASDYDLSAAGVSELSAPALALKGHLSKGWFDGYLGVGVQYSNLSSSKYETSKSDTVALYGPGGFIGYSTVLTKDEYSVAGGGITPLFQLGASAQIWKGLELGLHLEATPWDTTTVTNTSAETSSDGGSTWSPVNGTFGNKVTFTNLAQLMVGLGWKF